MDITVWPRYYGNQIELSMTMTITIIVFIDGLLAPNQTNGKRDYRRNLKNEK